MNLLFNIHGLINLEELLYCLLTNIIENLNLDDIVRESTINIRLKKNV